MHRWTRTEPPPPGIDPRTCEHCGAPLRGYWLEPGRWQWVVCGCHDPDVMADEGRRHVTDTSLHDALGEPHDLEGRH
jgi:hypothetical protein